MAAKESKARHPSPLNIHAQQNQQDDASRRRERVLRARLEALVLRHNRERDGAARRREAYNRQIELFKETKPAGWRQAMMHNRDAAWERWLGRSRQLQRQRVDLQREIERERTSRKEEKDDTASLGGGGRRRRRKSRRKKRRRRKTRRRPGKRKRRRRRTRR